SLIFFLGLLLRGVINERVFYRSLTSGICAKWYLRKVQKLLHRSFKGILNQRIEGVNAARFSLIFFLGLLLRGVINERVFYRSLTSGICAKWYLRKVQKLLHRSFNAPFV
ncbi:MAG: hypothetical protein O7C62_08725, partial [Rickettsia endosymbiont of Ixodes persulcatus]|nr:hypothetical protein [Rickettsia endosymbiont of Ixodes persulcatus]